MTQLNTPYPSTAYLTGFLRSRGVEAVQEDLALALVLKLFSSTGLKSVFKQIEGNPNQKKSLVISNFCEQVDQYLATIDRVVAFLQGRDPTLAHRITSRMYLPEGPRFDSLETYEDEDDGGDPLGWAFGALGVQDRARHFATLYLSDLADLLREAIDPRFEFVRYAESLAASQPTFAPLADALAAPMNLVDEKLRDLTLAAITRHQPNIALVSVPFPGNVYAAFRIAQAIKSNHPEIITVLGGGFVNTELREITETRLFDYFDYITLDDGERPLLALLEHLRGERPQHQLVRTFVLENDSTTSDSGQVQYINYLEPDVPFAEVGTPIWDGLPIDQYLSTLDMLNPMHRLWSDGRWNKLTVAHGCYWKKCSFCDVTLDYIGRYDGVAATTLVDRIEEIIQETGETGFHFVDEAAPPKALRAMAEELLRRNVTVSWWGNIRFEKSFTPELCELLAESGCIAISGGLEVASDRLLKLMKKGVSVEQVARVTRAFSEVGILVHAYLMYGFPTQTVRDTVDALEYVRQLFEEGCIQSGFFHRFTCTVHSPVGKNPEEYGIQLVHLPDVSFAKNDIDFIDPTNVDHDALGVGLNKALYNFMHGVGLDADIRSWFESRVPRSKVERDFIAQALNQ